MYCKKCGKEIDYNTIYCPNCGVKIGGNKNENFKNGPSIIVELVVGAVALVIIGVGIYYFNLAHETLYTVNGIPSSEAPKFTTTGWGFLIVGLITAIFDIVSIYNKFKK